MDVFLALADSIGNSQLPLAVKETTTFEEAFRMIRMSYLPDIQLKVEDYKVTQPYVGEDGRVKLDIVPKDSNQVLMTFVNISSNITPLLKTSIAEPTKIDFMFEPLTVVKSEIEFIEWVGAGSYPPKYDTTNKYPYELAMLLNKYNYHGRWGMSTWGYMTTAGFQLIYFGPSEGVPEDFTVESSPYVMIIRIAEGETRGHICLRT